jgi:hypothetical protein
VKLLGLINWIRDGIVADEGVLPNQFVRECINDALCQIQQIRPELFAVSRSIKLKPGDEQVLDDCDLLLSVDAVTDAQGNKLGSVLMQELRLNRIASLFPARCMPEPLPGHLPQPANYTAIPDPVILNRFTVSPAVPKGADVHFRIRVSSIPQFFDDYEADASVPCAQYSLILMYAKSLALKRMSPDSPAAIKEANGLMTMFVQSAKNAQTTAFNIRRAA